MRRWIGWAARCYPAEWRRRYGDEFDAVLDQLDPCWRDLWNVLREALFMQLTAPSAYLKLGVATAIVGAIAAGAASFAMPRHYVSTAVIRLAPQTAGSEFDAARRIRDMQTELLSRRSLAELIQQPNLDLYREERRRYPMEDLIEEMRTRDLHIAIVQPPGPGKGQPLPSFQVSFDYPDPVKAQAVVRNLTTRFSELNAGTPGGGVVEVLTPASLPDKPTAPNRFGMMAIGLGAGLAAGILLAFLRRRPLKWTLRMAGFTLAGAVVGAAVAFLMSESFPNDQKLFQLTGLCALTGLTVGGFLLRDRRPGGSGYARLIAFSTACGIIAGGFISFALPERYVSTSVLRAYPHPGAPPQMEPAERLRQLTEQILSRGSLTELIQRPALDLYRAERSRHPMEDIVNGMRRRDIRISPAPPVDLTGLGKVTVFQVSFEYADRYKAQAVVRELVTKFVEDNFLAERKHRRDRTPGSLALEIVDPASNSPEPVWPNRTAIAGLGLLAGLLLGSLLSLRRWLASQPLTAVPRPKYWKYALTAASLGAATAALASFAVPDRYISTAVLRLAAVDGQSARERMQQMVQQVTSRDTLSEIVVRPSLDLYARERARRSMDDVIQQMRDRDLRVAPMPESPLGGHTTAFSISFVYGDREKAQACVQALVSKIVESHVFAQKQPDAAHLFDNPLAENVLPLSSNPPADPIVPARPSLNATDLLTSGGSALPAQHVGDPSAGDVQPVRDTTRLEVLDPASVPGDPVSPNRATITAIGCVAGLLLGVALARMRAPRPATA